MHVPVTELIHQDERPKRLPLKDVTSMVNISTGVDIFVVFSFEQSLIETVFSKYTEDIEIAEAEVSSALSETAGDISNIIVGNATADLDPNAMDISLSSPIIIDAGQWMTGHKEGSLSLSELSTDFGKVQVALFCPKLNELI